MGKHAYLIIAHKDDRTFRTLLRMLDYDKNDIFIHFDIKNRYYCEKEIEHFISESQVYHTARINIGWGGFSMVRAELSLLDLATKTGQYEYYHLLSGEDLPIKPQPEIHDFFNKNVGKEFINFNASSFNCPERVEFYHFFQEYVGRSGKNAKVFINNIFITMQKYICTWMGVKRNRNINFQKGAVWFSITDDLARYVVEKEKWLYKIFINTFCADEIFLQTLVINSSFRENLYYKVFDDNPMANMRLVDWKRGLPYIFRAMDFDELMNSEMLFARKFSADTDGAIIHMVAEAVSQKIMYFG